jgi:hypothetical protein
MKPDQFSAEPQEPLKANKEYKKANPRGPIEDLAGE